MCCFCEFIESACSYIELAIFPQQNLVKHQNVATYVHSKFVSVSYLGWVCFDSHIIVIATSCITMSLHVLQNLNKLIT